MDAELRDKFVADLREFADFIEDNGEELPITEFDCDLKLTSWIEDEYEEDSDGFPGEVIEGSAKQKLKDVVKVLGSVKKDWSDNYLDVRKEFGSITLEFTIGRSKVCKRVVKEVIEHPARLVPARREEIVEWECDDMSLLR